MKWNRCDKKMPKEDDWVIVTIYGEDFVFQKDGETFEDAIKRTREAVRVTIGVHKNGKWIGVDGLPMIACPVAWTQLPSHYKEKR